MTEEIRALAEMEVGERVRGLALVLHVDFRVTSSGKGLILLSLRDRTGTLPAKIWEPTQWMREQVRAGRVIRFTAEVQEYRGNRELKILELDFPEDYPHDHFLPREENLDAVLAEIRQRLESLENAPLRTLCLRLEERFRSQLRWAPAARRFHHNTLGGLAVHILSLLRLGEIICQHYAFLQRDLVLAGLFLHDIGKVREFRADTDIEYTDEGRLLGHIHLGAEMVLQEIQQIPDFPENLKTQLLHIILSHHGTLEFGSPVVPMTAEAMVVHLLDNLDAKMWAIRKHLQTSHQRYDGWTEYHEVLERFFFKGGEENAGTPSV